jgi:hypothetical protein
MTYNFDPDKWYENQRAALEARRLRGELDEAAFRQALAELDDRAEAMAARLDGTFEIPGPTKD